MAQTKAEGMFNKTNFANFNPNYQPPKRQIPTKKQQPVAKMGKTGLNFYNEGQWRSNNVSVVYDALE